MAVRIISGVVGLPILIILVLLGGVYLKLSVAVISVIGMYEFYLAVSSSKKILPIHYIGFISAVVYICFIDLGINNFFSLILISTLILLLIMQVFMHKTINIIDTAVTLFAVIYISFMFANIYLLRISPLGKYIVWLPFICAWSCDTGAYFTGMAFGRHKLAPILSPKKTIEGAVGGILFAGIGCAIFGYIFSELFDGFGLMCLIIGLVGSVFAQLGDLAASSIKRYTGIKDFGNIMPGHGGVVDRFDSVIFTSAVVYIMTNVMIKL